jgi:hypothetical protein
MADVSIDAAILADTARGLRSVVFTTASIGYFFYIDSTGTFVYSKTTDGGATWGAAVAISAQTTDIAFDVWFDKWTPGDSGTLIHTWCFDTGVDDLRYRTLDTATDTLGTLRVVNAAASALAGRSAFISGTKCASGRLYCAANIDGGTEDFLFTSNDAGVTWGTNLSTTFHVGTDQCLLFPAMNAGSNDDIVAIFQNSAGNILQLKTWIFRDAGPSAGGTMNTLVINTTDLTGQNLFSASIRHSDGHIIVVSCSERDSATGDMQVYDCNVTYSGGPIFTSTAKTAITTNIDDCYYPAVFIDQNTNDIYVAYQGKRDGSEVLGTTTKTYYTKSTDGGTTWSAGDTAYQEGATSANFQTWAPISGPLFYVGWRVGTTLVGNKVNAVNVTPVIVMPDLITEPMTPEVELE